ncbi:MAG: folate-binding protein YgfZ [Methyloceanibacter sp.]
MSQCSVALLADRAVVRVTGSGARAFLQGLITNDIEKAKAEAAIHAGLLTPQGKILFDFFVVPAEDGFLLDVAKAKAGELMQRLGFYRLRAQVEIAEEPLLTAAAAWGAPPQLPKGAVSYADPRLPALGLRILLPSNASLADLGCAVAATAVYHARRIALGVPEGGRDYAYGDTFPHEVLFDQLNGVDFKKGCFVGQEVVSRMEHRGTARKRIVGIEGEGPLPASGTEITAGGHAIGTLGSVNGASGLALLRLDRAEEALAAGLPLQAGDVAVALRIPAWVRFPSPTPISP